MEVKCTSCGAVQEVTEPQKCSYCGTLIKIDKAKENYKAAKSGEVGNLMMLAETGIEAENWEEALLFYNRVLEKDVTNVDAWLGKGIAIVYTSKIGDLKTNEAITYWKSAVKYAENQEAMGKRVAKEINTVVNSFYPVLENHFVKFSGIDNSFNELISKFVLLEKAQDYATQLDSNNIEFYYTGYNICKRIIDIPNRLAVTNESAAWVQAVSGAVQQNKYQQRAGAEARNKAVSRKNEIQKASLHIVKIRDKYVSNIQRLKSDCGLFTSEQLRELENKAFKDSWLVIGQIWKYVFLLGVVAGGLVLIMNAVKLELNSEVVILIIGAFLLFGAIIGNNIGRKKLKSKKHADNEKVKEKKSVAYEKKEPDHKGKPDQFEEESSSSVDSSATNVDSPDTQTQKKEPDSQRVIKKDEKQSSLKKNIIIILLVVIILSLTGVLSYVMLINPRVVESLAEEQEIAEPDINREKHTGIINPSDDFVDFRGGKGNSYDIVGRINKWDKFIYYPDQSNWWEVELLTTEQKGYIERKYILNIENQFNFEAEHLFREFMKVFKTEDPKLFTSLLADNLIKWHDKQRVSRKDVVESWYSSYVPRWTVLRDELLNFEEIEPEGYTSHVFFEPYRNYSYDRFFSIISKTDSSDQRDFLINGYIYYDINGKIVAIEDLFTERVPDDIIYITGSNVNIRPVPSLDSEVLFQLNIGDECKVLSQGHSETINNHNDYWYQIEANRKHGWVFGRFTTKSTLY